MIAPVPSWCGPTCANVASGPGLRWGVVIGVLYPPMALSLARPKCEELEGEIPSGSPGSRLGLRRPSDVIEFEWPSCEREEPDVPFPLPLPFRSWDELEPRDEELYAREGARESEPEATGESGLRRSGMECKDALAL